MQSAAKVGAILPRPFDCTQYAFPLLPFLSQVPILVAFKVIQGDLVKAQEEAPEEEEEASAGAARNLACIFKVGDDVRQDVLALQVISLLKNAFIKAGLDLYLCPYGCLPTGYECGIIEVVPKTKSRAALGELSDRGLYEIFQTEFGAANSPAFEAARRNFIVSEAGYAIASFLLQVCVSYALDHPNFDLSSPFPSALEVQGKKHVKTLRTALLTPDNNLNRLRIGTTGTCWWTQRATWSTLTLASSSRSPQEATWDSRAQHSS